MKFLITGANGDIAISISRIIQEPFKNSIIDGTDTEVSGPGEIYYKKIHNKDSVKDKPIIKKRKRTKKKLGKDRLSVKKDETEDNDENSDNEPISIVAKQEKEKLTKKKQFVIMD